ncbi:sterigmatocystin biosynthesis monooxygenase stcW [Fusarium pseudocircinatum]|uniref:Sterigmatocystin biosynthesis monooxygenase stcW n=1 Tax=Fusarium pseudocircinatum TaxID=56676 RepID=A0A8H5PJU3_9HYPO|nr:sterigmatocystin biosynthesis monooxygenase stcW [Fusarium pseudocircinatum]
MSAEQQRKPKQIRCTIIGAGVSGILMAYKLKQHLNDYVTFQIFEKSPDLGGTWFENKYPGCACDVPSHCYQYSFAPNPSWSKFYASSDEIQGYLKGVTRHFDLERYISFNTKVVSARWSESDSIWTVQLANGSLVTSEILVNAGGILNHPQIPNIEGLSDFSGPLLHTASWDHSIDLRGKRVGVIGAGASAIQLVPSIQPLVRDMKVFIRTPSWIAPPVALPDPNATNYTYSIEERAVFEVNKEMYLDTRKRLEDQFNGMFRLFIKSSPEQKRTRDMFESRMKQLIPDQDLQKKLIPPFEAGCRRINPGEGFLTALQKPNVEPVFDSIQRVTQGGIVAGGKEYPVDVLVAATGFNTTFRPRFPIVGRNGVNLQDAWQEHPESYLGLGVAGFPNYLIFLGPNTPISNGSLMGSVEATADYFIRLLHKMIRQRVKSFEVRAGAQEDFNIHTQTVMQDMVWTGTCRSWCSSLHYIQVLSEDRWEDYKWTHESERYSYWGHGLSWIEEPSLDPLGATKQDMIEAMTTLPKKDSDLSFYLWKSSPLPETCFASGLPVEEAQDGGDMALRKGLHATAASEVDKHTAVACITVPV